MSQARRIERARPSGLALRKGPRGRGLTVGLIVVILLVAIGVLVALTVDTRSFYYPLGVFSYVMGWTGLPLAYPLIAVAVFVLPFTERLRERQIFYTRLRLSIRRQLTVVAITNATIAFVVFFIFVFATFCFVFYVQPALPVTHFDSFESGTYPEDFQLARMTELLKISPLVYGIVYSVWSGLNAAVWASFGLVAVLTIRNRFVALAFPFILFVVLGFGFGIMGGVFAQNTPWTLWVLFSFSQVSMWPSIVMLAALVLAAGASVAITIARANQLEALQ